MNKKEEIREWHKYGLNDYNTAVFLQNMTPPPLEIICYHCQQAAEKYLKSFLVLKNEPVMKTHDLSFLAEICIKIDSDFESIIQSCEELTDYSISTRYPSNIEINLADMKKAILDCEKV
ncbi:MAG TPA: HEPN domain-containing protein, partial [Spirochaetota bacterium]|nr:HEPN domain-containing protein [Spirochaetota bacterium]